METEAVRQAMEIMRTFADETGLTSEREPRRYLWTDAFAVCTYLALHSHTGDTAYIALARDLVDQVHYVLGRHRADDPRTGWISGLDEEEGAQHPTRGGLRIGKPLPQRRPDEPYDRRLEWDRDGQYFHYLTKWMHALRQMGAATGDPVYLRWAVELAEAAHAAFVITPEHGRMRMVWKMSIDLDRALVPSMGRHDPLDGLITYQTLRAAEAHLQTTDETPRQQTSILEREVRDMTALCAGRNWATDDPLGLGGLLTDAYHVAQLPASTTLDPFDLLITLLAASRTGLRSYAAQSPLQQPAPYRLAFRELGLAIGVEGAARLRTWVAAQHGLSVAHPELPKAVESLTRFLPLGDRVTRFWLENEHQNAQSWTAHQDINAVMLATSLVPDGYLEL